MRSSRLTTIGIALILLSLWLTSTYEQDQRDELRRQEWCAAYTVTSGCFEYPDNGTGR